MEEPTDYDLGGEMETRKENIAYKKPTKGTSVEKFREMIINHLKVKKIFTVPMSLNLKPWFG